ncbi:MAG: hypothetical protein ACP5NX_03120 [Candidatus Bilamarchaeaceae archaeon]
MRTFILLLLVCSLGMAVNMIEPLQTNVADGSETVIGLVGPGQTLAVSFDPKVTEGGTNGVGGVYDLAYAVETPDGWQVEKSSLYGNPLQVKITVDPEAADGEYPVKLVIEDEKDGEKLGKVTATIKVQVSRDIMEVSIQPKEASVSPNQPARYYITIANRGRAGDVFEITNDQASKRLQFRKTLYVPPNEARTLVLEMSEAQEEMYVEKINVKSVSSPLIHAEGGITLKVNPSLIGDWKATNRGVLVFPIYQSIIYSFAGLISNLFA